MSGGWQGIRTAVTASLLALLTGCGQGIFTRSRSAFGADAATPDGGAPTVDFGPEKTVPPPDNGSDGAGSAGGSDAMEAGDAQTVSSLNIKAGMDGVLQLDEGSVTVRSMSFAQDVVLTIEIADPSTLGSIDKAFRVSLQPAGTHSRNTIRLAVSLDAASDAIHDQFKLASYQVRVPVGIWTAAPGQQYDAATHSLWAEFSGLDKEPIIFALLRTCTDNHNCSPRQNCNANLCQ